MTHFSATPPLKSVDLSLLVPAGILERGRDYVAGGRVRAAVRLGPRMAAVVEGREPYRAWAEVPGGAGGVGAPSRGSAARPRSAGSAVLPLAAGSAGGARRDAVAWRTGCSCPLRRQPCKHAAALLHLWSTAPEQFVDLSVAAALLRRRDDGVETGLAALLLADVEPDWTAVLSALAVEARVEAEGAVGRRAAVSSGLPRGGSAPRLSLGALPLDTRLAILPDLPESEDAAVWRSVAAEVQAVGAEAERSASVADHLDHVWRLARVARWGLAFASGGAGAVKGDAADAAGSGLGDADDGTVDGDADGLAGEGDIRAGGDPDGPAGKGADLSGTLSAVLNDLADMLGRVAEDGAVARRRRAFDAVAGLACDLPKRRQRDLSRLLNRARKLLPATEADTRWAAVAARQASCAQRGLAGLAGGHDDTGDARARLALENAVRAWAAGWRAAGRPARAVAVWELHSDLPEADEGRVRAWAEAGDWERTRDTAQTGLARAPHERVPWFRRQLALAWLRLNDPARAAPLFAANFEETPTLRAYKDFRAAAQAAGVWPDSRAQAAAHLCEAAWPATGVAHQPASRAHWHSVAEAAAEDAPLLALRYVAAARQACLQAPGANHASRVSRRSSHGSGGSPEGTFPHETPADAAGGFLALGESLAISGGPRRLAAWRNLLGD